jgi:uncharacterized protein (TIGR03382 family)
VNDTCRSGTCTPGPAPSCTWEDDQCNTGTCVSLGSAAYNCVKDPSGHEGDPCEDDALCTWNDTCTGGQCTGQEADCQDGVSCTVDLCDPSTGGCNSTPADARCEDGSDCTVDSCDAAQGCASKPLADWTSCGGDDAQACFSGACQPLAPNDTCPTAADLPLNQELDLTLEGYHPWRDASVACDQQGLSGRDSFYQLQLQAGWKYSLTLTPAPGLDLALVLWDGCDAPARCLAALNDAGPGAPEGLLDYTPTTSGTLILQFLALGQADDPSFKLLVLETPPDSGEDTGPDTDVGSDTDLTSQPDLTDDPDLVTQPDADDDTEAVTQPDTDDDTEAVTQPDTEDDTDLGPAADTTPTPDLWDKPEVLMDAGSDLAADLTQPGDSADPQQDVKTPDEPKGGGGGCNTAPQGHLSLLPLLVSGLILLLRRRRLPTR